MGNREWGIGDREWVRVINYISAQCPIPHTPYPITHAQSPIPDALLF